MTDRRDDIPLTDEEHALAERGRRLVASAVASPEARAPQALLQSLAAAGTARGGAPQRRRSRPRLVSGALGLLAIAGLALVMALGGSDGGPASRVTVETVASIARLAASAPAPTALGGQPPRLDARVGGLQFPDWREAYEWQATGRRSDRIGGRMVTTVFYRYPHGARPTIGYAIVAGAPVGVGEGRDVTRRGARYRVSARAGRRTVTWTQAGHTCVIDAPSTVSAAELVKLASWA